MRDYGKAPDSFWTDFKGRTWPVIRSRNRLKFKYPLHAALRAHIFNRDGYSCLRCEASALTIPHDYDGKETLQTNTYVCNGEYRDILVLDHIVTLRAGGENIVSNLQTLCETCNKRKIKEDNETYQRFKEAL